MQPITHWEHGKRKPEDVGVVLRLLNILGASEGEKTEILTSIGYEQPFSDNLKAEDFLAWIDEKLGRIVGLRSETTDQIEDLRRLVQQELLARKSFRYADLASLLPHYVPAGARRGTFTRDSHAEIVTLLQAESGGMWWVTGGIPGHVWPIDSDW